jgi:hypothetical protein
MWHAHLAPVFTDGTPVPLFQTDSLRKILDNCDGLSLCHGASTGSLRLCSLFWVNALGRAGKVWGIRELANHLTHEKRWQKGGQNDWKASAKNAARPKGIQFPRGGLEVHEIPGPTATSSKLVPTAYAMRYRSLAATRVLASLGTPRLRRGLLLLVRQRNPH